MRKTFLHIISITWFLLFSCHPALRSPSVQYSNYSIQPSGEAPSAMGLLMKPYSDSVNKSMNDVIGYNETLLEKKTGECTLGYFMTDAFLFMARQKFNTPVHAAFMNYGGIRLNELPSGNVTRGKLYELMPFDNFLLLQKVKGNILKQYLDTRGEADGSCMTGITMNVKNKAAYTIMIDTKPLDENAEYVIANSDYSINNSAILKTIPVQSINYLQRDALVDYVTFLKKEGKNITVTKTQRISNDQ